MTRQKKPVKQTREHYLDEYKAEVLKLAQRIGASAAAKELGIHGK